jgi:hypothetical protein
MKIIRRIFSFLEDEDEKADLPPMEALSNVAKTILIAGTITGTALIAIWLLYKMR